MTNPALIQAIKYSQAQIKIDCTIWPARLRKTGMEITEEQAWLCRSQLRSEGFRTWAPQFMKDRYTKLANHRCSSLAVNSQRDLDLGQIKPAQM